MQLLWQYDSFPDYSTGSKETGHSLGNIFLSRFRPYITSLELTYEICDMLYELGISWEKAGEVANAKKCFETIYGFDINYRDVAKRILDNKYKLTT